MVEEKKTCLVSVLFSGIVLRRVGYYTLPSMEDLADMLDGNGNCVVENFSVGRKGNTEHRSASAGQLGNRQCLGKCHLFPVTW